MTSEAKLPVNSSLSIRKAFETAQCLHIPYSLSWDLGQLLLMADLCRRFGFLNDTVHFCAISEACHRI